MTTSLRNASQIPTHRALDVFPVFTLEYRPLCKPWFGLMLVEGEVESGVQVVVEHWRSPLSWSPRGEVHGRYNLLGRYKSQGYQKVFLITKQSRLTALTDMAY